MFDGKAVWVTRAWSGIGEALGYAAGRSLISACVPRATVTRLPDALFRPAYASGYAWSSGIRERCRPEMDRRDREVRRLHHVTAEYNYGPAAVLKNAIDWVYPEWKRKAAAFVSYGTASGVRGVQQLREIAIELQLAPIRSSVHIPAATLRAHFQGGDVDAGLTELEGPAEILINDLLWWTEALRAARGRS